MCSFRIHQGRPTFFSRGPNLLFQKFGEPKFKGEDQKKKKKGLRSDLISVFSHKAGEDHKKGFCGIFLQLTTSARRHQSTNQRKNLSWAILKPLAGRGSDALDYTLTRVCNFLPV